MDKPSEDVHQPKQTLNGKTVKKAKKTLNGHEPEPTQNGKAVKNPGKTRNVPDLEPTQNGNTVNNAVKTGNEHKQEPTQNVKNAKKTQNFRKAQKLSSPSAASSSVALPRYNTRASKGGKPIPNDSINANRNLRKTTRATSTSSVTMSDNLPSPLGNRKTRAGSSKIKNQANQVLKERPRVMVSIDLRRILDIDVNAPEDPNRDLVKECYEYLRKTSNNKRDDSNTDNQS